LKAIIVNRVSDFGLLLGIIIIGFIFLSFDFEVIKILHIFFIFDK
jgi:NADH:ubiquinone oxidoreductase subunit 5 (subunit L)/multisubunit Na+/H+ antiporter MnhA subunit